MYSGNASTTPAARYGIYMGLSPAMPPFMSGLFEQHKAKCSDLRGEDPSATGYLNLCLFPTLSWHAF
jgi:hypothetical protein